ncbi:hypothetical protein GQX73_g725 [Xylaria multiplex]|uniref:Uncharacterized protein n=1 Tax=Xylaria multiplex TaxID=323545 RepID=A0A7C8IUV6_9PEZI|nr:hypothetical protein GQX73_g725 [Xylaria multiplex]
MAAEPSPKLHHLKYPESQFDSQTSTVLEQNFLAPLKDSQEVQGVAPEWHDDIGGHKEENGTDQPLKPTQGPFFSRPMLEDPLNFQDGFQYSKAPTPHIQLNRPLAPRNVLGLQINLKNDSFVKTEHPPHNSDCQIIEDPLGCDLDNSRDIGEAGIQTSLPAPNMKMKTYDTASIRSHHSSKGTVRTYEGAKESTHSLSGPPFKNTSPIINKGSALPQQRKAHIRSSAAQLEGHKLPKTITDIQRKALIQSKHTNRISHPVHRSKGQIEKSLSPRPNTPEVHQDLVNDYEVLHTRTTRSQGWPARDPAWNQPTDIPRAQAMHGEPRKNRSSVAEMTRPFVRDAHEDYSTTRTVSRASNISKIRAPLGKERRRARVKRAIPGMEESNALRYQLSQSWNKFFGHENERNKFWEKKITEMEEQLTERDGKISDYLEEIHRRGQIIEDLENVKKEQNVLCQEKEAALSDLTERVQRLREKMREYKDHLNDATKEQQNIFNYIRPKYHQMREQLKQAELNHQNSLEQALSVTKVAREEIRDSVNEVQALSQQEIHKLRLEIRTLEVKLAEREKDVNREKDHINDLRRELRESHELNRDALRSLHTQNHELMKKSDERAIQIQTVEHGVNQQEQRIQSLQKFLEDDKATSLSPSELVESLKALQTGALNHVLSDFREYTESDREQSSQAIEGLKSDILAVREVCTGLCEKIQSNQNASEWQEKFGEAQTEFHALLRQMDRLKEKLARTQDEAKMQLEQQERLQQELVSLRANALATGEFNSRIENLQREKGKIQGLLDEKQTCIRGLEDELRRVYETLSAQECRLKDNERQFQDEQEKLMQTVASCHEQKEQAVKQAREEECMRTRAEYRDIKDRLHEAEQDCGRLQNELVQVQLSAESALKDSRDSAAKQAQEVLQPIIGLMNKVSEGLQTSKHAKDDLNAKLEAWSSGHAELSLLRQAVRKIEKDQEKATENGSRLRELLDIQKKLDDTWQWHRAEVDALHRAIELEKSVKADTERFNRRVTIRSPGINDNHNQKMVPVSNEEERATRRQTGSLKSIMKPVMSQVERRPEEQYHKAFSHSAYNRPVLGPPTSVEEESVNETIPKSAEIVSTEESRSRKRKSVETETKPRENAEEQSQSAENPRAKISRSMSNAFHDPVPKPTTNSILLQAELFHVRGGPIERRSRSLITYGSPHLDIRGVGSGDQESLLENRETHTHSFNFIS